MTLNVVVGAGLAGPKQTADLLGFSHRVQPPLGFAEIAPQKRRHPVSGSPLRTHNPDKTTTLEAAYILSTYIYRLASFLGAQHLFLGLYIPLLATFQSFSVAASPPSHPIQYIPAVLG